MKITAFFDQTFRAPKIEPPVNNLDCYTALSVKPNCLAVYYF